MRKVFFTILLFALSFSLTYGQTNATAPAGSGTDADPYQIASLANLSWLTQNDSICKTFTYYILSGDIDASETATWDDTDDNSDGDRYNDANDLTQDGTNDGWLPIGTVSGTESFFSGNINGNNHSIDGLSIINRASFAPEGYGFIRVVDNVVIENLALKDINFNGNSYGAGLVCKGDSLIIRNCSVTGVLNQNGAGEIVAGLVGRVYSGVFIVEDSYTDIEINADLTARYVAGFVCYIDGASSGSHITRSHSSGNINGGSYTVGGFLSKPQASECVVSECYNEGNVAAGHRIGGFVAYNKKGIIKDCYNLGNVTSLDNEEWKRIGPFVGYNAATIEKSYSTGSLTFSTAIDTNIVNHGFVGQNKSTLTNCFFDSTKSNQVSDDSIAIAKTTSEMQTDSTFTNAGWNFTSIWKTDKNYPNLLNHLNTNLEPLPVTNMAQPSGAGTVADPYQIETLAHLSWLTQNYTAWNSHFVQIGNINVSETATWDYDDDDGDGDRFNDQNDIKLDGTNDGWLPIGGEFKGTYDGGGFAIDGLTMNKTTGVIGLFKAVKDATIKNLGLTNVDIKGTEVIGALTGYCYGNLIDNCYATGTITSDSTHQRIGGLIAYISGSTVNAVVSNCYADVEIINAKKYVGGFVGNIKSVESATITNCYALGNIINANEAVGGFAGKIERSENIVVDQCYSTGDVVGNEYTGGFVGYLKTGPVVSNCYALGNISQVENENSEYLGGFCGYNNEATINKSYSTGLITSTYLDSNNVEQANLRNGFVGRQNGTVTACFFDKGTSNRDSSAVAIGKSTSEMMMESTFADSSWDVSTIWKIDKNYPNLVNNLNPDLKPLPMINATVPAGSGTLASPYEIATLENLSWLTQNYTSWNKYFVQVADVNAIATKYWDDNDDNGDGDKFNDPNDLTSAGNNDGWLPVELFTGSYDGDEKVIDSLTINRTGISNGVGFFRVIQGGKIENLGLTNVDIKGRELVGVLAASCKENIITNCYTTGTLTLTNTEKLYKYGGFLGRIITGISEISSCYSEVNILGTPLSCYIGGFVGNIKGVPAGSITDCYTTGNITTGGESCAGFVGKNEAKEFEISKCYSAGDVFATGRSGGFVAYNKNGTTITDCYSLGNVTSTATEETEFGGFCGYNYKSNIKNSYSIGSVFFPNATDSTDTTGVGFVGRDKDGIVTACFFNKTVSNQDSSAIALGKTTVEMLTISTFTDAGWDFTEVWEKVGRRDYPTLRKPTVSVQKEPYVEIPTSFKLEQNYPNPFNPTTTINFALPKVSDVQLSVYNILGEKVVELVNKKMIAGYHTVNFNAANLASGIYIYRIYADNFISVRKMMLLK